MKHLTLVRHAKSSWDNLGLSDFERPLNARGEATAPRMGRFLAQDYLQTGRLPGVDLIVSSPACRALTTARIIATEIGYPPENIVAEPRIYEASPRDLVQVVQELEDRVGHALLFGHNPGFESLARTLDPDFRGDGEKFPTCGVALLKLNLESWQELGPECTAASEFLYPGMIPT